MFTRLMAATLAALIAMPAVAQPMRCGERDAVLRQLDQRFDEKPVAVGLSRRGVVIEILASADGGTWTMLMTLPQGRTCLLDAGRAWLPVNISLDPEA